MKAPRRREDRCTGTGLSMPVSSTRYLEGERYRKGICPACGEWRRVNVLRGQDVAVVVAHPAKVWRPAVKQTLSPDTIVGMMAAMAAADYDPGERERQERETFEHIMLHAAPTFWDRSKQFDRFLQFFLHDATAKARKAGIGDLLMIEAHGVVGIGADRREALDRLIANLRDERDTLEAVLTASVPGTQQHSVINVRLGLLRDLPITSRG